MLTPLEGVGIVYASQRVGDALPALRFCSKWSSPSAAPAAKNTPKERPKLIENSGFECIERAYFGRHYVLLSPTFGSGRSNNIDSERSIYLITQYRSRSISELFFKLFPMESLILAQDERWRRA